MVNKIYTNTITIMVFAYSGHKSSNNVSEKRKVEMKSGRVGGCSLYVVDIHEIILEC